MKILVVDDYAVIRKIHINNFNRMGIMDVDQAENGNEAVEAANRIRYDLILLDWHMPGMNGLEVLKILRTQGNNVPIVFCTDESEKDSIKSAMLGGATRYITKPYTPTQFRTIMSEILGIKI